MDERSMDLISSSMSTSTTSTSSINSRKTSNFFPQFGVNSVPSFPQSHSHPQSTSQSYSQIANSGSGSYNTPYMSQGANMMSAPITPLLNGSNNSTPLFNDHSFGQLDTSIWNNSLTPNVAYNTRPHSFTHTNAAAPDDFRTRFNSSDGLTGYSNQKWNQFQFQFDESADTNNYTSQSYNNDMLTSFHNLSINESQDVSDTDPDDDILNQSINMALALDMEDDDPLLNRGSYEAPGITSSFKATGSYKVTGSHKATGSNIMIDIPRSSTAPLSPRLQIEKFPEIFSSSFYKRNDNGYMFIKETNDELIKVNQLSTQRVSDVTIDVQLNINNACELVNIKVDQLYNTELFNDVKIMKRKANVQKRFRST